MAKSKKSKAEEDGGLVDWLVRRRAEALAGPFAKDELDAALVIAAQRDDGQVARMLALGANPNVLVGGEHALGAAAAAGAPLAIANLLAAGADAKQLNAQGLSPFARAAIGESEACMRLLAQKSDVDLEFTRGTRGPNDREIVLTPLAQALIFGTDESCLAFLLEISDLGVATWIQGRSWTARQLALEWATSNNAAGMLEREEDRRKALAEGREIAEAASCKDSGKAKKTRSI